MHLHHNRLTYVLMLLVVVLAGLTVTGCSCVSSSPVTYISDFRGTSPGVPPGAWVDNAPTAAFIKQPQREYAANEKIFIGVRLSRQVTFSRYTFYNRSEAVETEIHTSDLGPFEPGIHFPGINDPWRVPDTPGIYDLRLYAGEKVIASVAITVAAVQ